MAESAFLTEVQGAFLLRCARNALVDYFANEGIRPCPSSDPIMQQKVGLFVTLWLDETAVSNRHNVPETHLRGCIGQVLAEQPLVELVPQMAVRAATADPRFPPLQASELPRVALELSVLSPLGRLYDVAQLAVGVHGLVIEANGRRGLLLPEVPLSRGWDGRQFLQAVCRKAGLPAQAWQWPEANLYTFTAQVFAEPIP